MLDTIMMKFLTCILFSFLLSTALFTQISEVSNSILDDNTAGFEFLDSELKNVRILGIGEATHGTKEFKTVQCNLFKYLVEKHGYTTFFLEDEYINCLPIDKYIKGGEGNIDSLVAGIRNWPWHSPQMKSLITWMRSYNKTNNNALSFVGVDFQDQKEFKDYLENEFKIKAVNKGLQEIIESLKNLKDRSEVELFLPSLQEWSYGDRKRDSGMARLIIQYLKINTKAKGVFCAHNTHLLKIYKDKKNDKNDWALAGGLLDHTLKDQYYVLLTDSDEGEFYAHSLKESGVSKKVYDNHEFVINKVTCPDQKYSLCKQLDGKGDILFVSELEKQESMHKWIHVTNIGATFYKKKNGKRSKFSMLYLEPEELDAILFFKTTTAATILE